MWLEERHVRVSTSHNHYVDRKTRDVSEDNIFKAKAKASVVCPPGGLEVEDSPRWLHPCLIRTITIAVTLILYKPCSLDISRHLKVYLRGTGARSRDAIAWLPAGDGTWLRGRRRRRWWCGWSGRSRGRSASRPSRGRGHDRAVLGVETTETAGVEETVSRPLARIAMRPITVRSPVLTTTPRHVPDTGQPIVTSRSAYDCATIRMPLLISERTVRTPDAGGWRRRRGDDGGGRGLCLQHCNRASCLSVS